MSLRQQLAQVRAGLCGAADRDGVLQAAAAWLACPQADAEALRDSLQTRERLGSTAIGHGIAIPHGRSAKLDAPRGVLLRLHQPIAFDASDHEPVDLVFAMAVPDHYTHQHLLLLSELAERFSDPDFRAGLREAPDATSMLALLLDDAPPAEVTA